MTISPDPFEKPNVLIRIVAVILGVFALFLLIGGLYLIQLGGSWYYGVIGAVLVVSVILIWGGRVSGVRLYLLAVLATVIWAIWEVGLNFWPLLPRLVAPLFMAGVLLVLVPFFPVAGGRPERSKGYVMTGLACFLGFGLFLVGTFFPHDVISNEFEITQGQADAATQDAGTDWPVWGRTGHGTRYLPESEITPENIQNLEVAWTARTGFIPDQDSYEQDQNTPLYIDGMIYACAHSGQISAIDGTTGEIKWQFDPKAESTDWKRCRSLAYYDPGPGDACGPRLVETTVDARLISVKASDGTICESFGKSGSVDLWKGMGASNDDFEWLTNSSGPVVANGKIIVNGRVVDNIKVGAPSGVIRAYDAKTGDFAWAWDLGRPDRKTEPPEGETYTLGTPNSWTLMSYDEELGMVYVPLGNPAPDIWGAKRREFDEKYGSSIVALDIATGDEVWHYQTVHHDLWDYDLPSQPVLTDVPDKDGKMVPAVIVPTKRAQVFVLDRRTGEPVKATEERPAPKSDGTVEGEHYAETQPYSVEIDAIGAEPLEERHMWGATPVDQMLCRIYYRKYRYEGEFTTPSENWSIIYPGPFGGINYGSTAIDQKRNVMVAAYMRFPLFQRLLKQEDKPQGAEYTGESGRWHPMEGTPYVMERMGFMSPLMFPCQEPPWGMVAAIDLKSGKQIWQQPAGTSRDLTMGSFSPGVPFYTGMPPLGGPLITQDVAWYAGTNDFYLRAYHVVTGERLWEDRLPTGSQASPISYVGKDGRQYVVISASGGRYNPKDWGDYLVAYALPKAN